MDTNKEFFKINGWNRDELIRQFIMDFANKYPHIDVMGVSSLIIKEFLHQPHVVQAGTEKKMDLLQDFLMSRGLCDVQE
jgi:hypothetical protein